MVLSAKLFVITCIQAINYSNVKLAVLVASVCLKQLTVLLNRVLVENVFVLGVF